QRRLPGGRDGDDLLLRHRADERELAVADLVDTSVRTGGEEDSVAAAAERVDHLALELAHGLHEAVGIDAIDLGTPRLRRRRRAAVVEGEADFDVRRRLAFLLRLARGLCALLLLLLLSALRAARRLRGRAARQHVRDARRPADAVRVDVDRGDLVQRRVEERVRRPVACDLVDAALARRAGEDAAVFSLRDGPD